MSKTDNQISFLRIDKVLFLLYWVVGISVLLRKEKGGRNKQKNMMMLAHKSTFGNRLNARYPESPTPLNCRSVINILIRLNHVECTILLNVLNPLILVLC